ncbi:hypothetical protein PIB30_104768 [Stylosanthes scabra]|uniref:Uncharacterized protein n=1 Tax=Stylosanthes scabra TaxID=79078 RepID=A0ABU6V251_9FABA|nr:hypothetical protein [Stylosanthes scabra]
MILIRILTILVGGIIQISVGEIKDSKSNSTIKVLKILKDNLHSPQLNLLKSNRIILNTNSFMDETRANLRNQEASIRNLEIQMGQIVNKSLKNHQTFFLVILSRILDKSARRLHLEVGRQQGMTLKTKNQLKILVPHLPKRKKK